MNQTPALFEAQFSPESMRMAGVAFRNYLFKRYGPLLVTACAINVAGFAFAVWLGAELGPALYWVAFVVVLGPIWLLYKYFAGPHQQAQRLQQLLPARGSVSVSDEFALLPGPDGRQLTFVLSKTKVIEHESLFLLVRSPFFAYYVPKLGMPLTVKQVFQRMTMRDAA